jgi:hypothetical protein
MARNLDPRLIAFEGKLERGAILRLDPADGSGDALSGKVLRFQYNPETLTRTRTGRWEPRKKRKQAFESPQAVRARSGQGSSALMAESEQISLKIVFDATEAVLAGRSSPDGAPVADQGVLPELAFLELASIGREGKEKQKGVPFEAIQPVRPDELLLVLGQQRMFPCVLTSITITEQKFLPSLAPLRAEVELKLNVLEPTESAYRHWIDSAFAQLHRARTAAQEQAVADDSVVQAIAAALTAGAKAP